MKFKKLGREVGEASFGPHLDPPVIIRNMKMTSIVSLFIGFVLTNYYKGIFLPHVVCEGYVFTGVCLSTRGGGIPVCLAAGLRGGGGIPACFAGFQAHTQGGS